ncbi:MAG TPA: hypothetical protein VED83_06840 [Burkholderiaceae bacterium]|nr:hypothetical protein [Burkholderiaceae bacterium]
MRSAAAVFFYAFTSLALAQGHADSCQAQIPRSLADALAKTFPGYRAPLEYDNAPEDASKNRTQGGSGCLGVGVGDFTGEGKKEYVIGLTALKGSGGLAVVALPRKGGWRFQKIRSGTEEARFRQFVEVVEPGHFERAKTRRAPLGTDEARALDCPNAGVRVGALDTTAIVYCFVAGRWQHVIVLGN